ncbi:MAG TPA: hypothetical protein VGH49_17995 [Xanthobacteraceae bacterium]
MLVAAPLAAIAAAATLTLASTERAAACQNYHGWSTGTDFNKLNPGEIVVKARLQEAYKSEMPIPVIMGNPHGMIYFVQIEKVVGGPGAVGGQAEVAFGKSIFILLRPSTCESYVPDNFGFGDLKTFVLKKGEVGLFELVGGQ